jgi:preprotein translocase subunit SecG
MTDILKRIGILVVILFVVTVFGLFALNFYRRSVVVDEPTEKPPVIFQRTDSPSRA